MAFYERITVRWVEGGFIPPVFWEAFDILCPGSYAALLADWPTIAERRTPALFAYIRFRGYANRERSIFPFLLCVGSFYLEAILCLIPTRKDEAFDGFQSSANSSRE